MVLSIQCAGILCIFTCILELTLSAYPVMPHVDLLGDLLVRAGAAFLSEIVDTNVFFQRQVSILFYLQKG